MSNSKKHIQSALFKGKALVEVGIMSEEKIEVKFNTPYTLQQNGAGCNGHESIFISNGNINMKGRAESYTDLLFVPATDNGNFTLADVTIGKNFHWEQKELQTFSGALRIIMEGNQLTAINIVPVEEYLTSVISSEMSATSSIELLKAHAVISRSWLLSQITNKNRKKATASGMTETEEEIIKWYDREDHTNFDVCADDHCQRYQGITRASTKTVREAIEATKGLVLMCDDEICDARFSKSCGGVSETFENCWEDSPHKYLVKVIDNAECHDKLAEDLTIEANAERWIRSAPESFCNTTDKDTLSQVLNSYDQETPDFYRWKVEYSQEEISDLIRRKSGIDFGDILDIVPMERGVSGRLVKMKIIGSKRALTIGKELEIRKILSESHLYSSAFVIDKEGEEKPSKFTLTGAGWGHGVGLCQIGAAVMASKGYSYKEILFHYYKNCTIAENYGDKIATN